MSGIVSETVPLEEERDCIHPPLKKYFCTSNELNDLQRLKQKRSERYCFRWLAANKFIQEGTILGLKYPQNFHRTAKCGCILVSNLAGLYYGLEHKRTFFKGLMTCGNVWTCAVCSAKIQERRRLEISDAMEWAYTEGKKCIMVTFTFPHTAFDDLSDMLKKQAEAFKILRTGKAWQKYKEKIGFIGLIRALEITVGVNGWHPHTHELWIVDNSTNVNDLYSVVYKRWEKACIHTEILKSEKLRDFRKRAVNIKDNAVNSDYFAKFDKLSAWGVDREIAKASTKNSSGCHPFELLSDFTEKLPLSKEIRSDMFVNYSMSMYGKKQIYWSQGLKEIAGIKEKTDEELCDESKEESVLFSLLNRKRVKYLYDNSSEQEIQYIAEVFGKEAAEEWFTDKGL